MAVSYLTKWNLSDFYKSDTDPQIDLDVDSFKTKAEAFISKWKARSDYMSSADGLLELLVEIEDLRSFGSEPFYYLYLRRNQDDKNEYIKAKSNKIEEISTKISNDLEFLTQNISRLPKDKQELFLSDKKLTNYHYALKNMFETAKYKLGEEAEQVDNLLSKLAFSDWTTMVEEKLSGNTKSVALENSIKKKYTYTQLFPFIENKDKEIRHKAAKAINAIMREVAEFALYELNAVLAYKKIEDDLRKYSRPDASTLISDDIDFDVIDALLDVVSANNTQAHAFYEFKARLLGLPFLEYYERGLSYGDITKDYTFDDGVTIVNKVFEKLDKDFSDIFISLLKGGKFDVFPELGKSGGAFCLPMNKNFPAFILLNHTNKLDDVTTIAHEMGHAINNVYMMRAQTEFNVGSSLATAEVASTFMEDFVYTHLLEGVSDEDRLTLLIKKLDVVFSAIHRQVACYKFEQSLHTAYRQTGYISQENIGQLFTKHMSAYMGPAVKQTAGSENWWVYWSHIRSFFYVYSYASGHLISMSMQRKLREDKTFINEIKKFLSSGISRSPKDIFLDLGIDISSKVFWEEGMKEIDTMYQEAVSLAKKLGKI